MYRPNFNVSHNMEIIICKMILVRFLI